MMLGDRTFVYDLAVVRRRHDSNPGQGHTRPEEPHSGTSQPLCEDSAVVALGSVLNRSSRYSGSPADESTIPHPSLGIRQFRTAEVDNPSDVVAGDLLQRFPA